MAVIAIQDASEGNQSITFAAAVGPDTVAQGARAAGWDLGVVLLVRNTDVAAKTVTVTDSAGGARVFVVPATTGFAVIPVYGVPYGQLQTVTYSAVVGVTVAAVRVAGD